MIIGRESPKLTGDSLTDARKLNSWNKEFTENYNLESSQMTKRITALESENTSLKQQVVDDNAGLQSQITDLSGTLTELSGTVSTLSGTVETQTGLFTAEWKAKVQTCINALYTAALPKEDLPFEDE